MSTYRAALTALAALSVPGVRHNFDADAVPDGLTRAQLPALLVLPGALRSGALFDRAGGGFDDAAFSGGAATVTHIVTHLLLAAPALAGRAGRAQTAALIDAYVAALRADSTLGGALAQPARLRIEPGVYAHGGLDYYGCAFRHTWMMELA
jgi:hypothetical protein